MKSRRLLLMAFCAGLLLSGGCSQERPGSIGPTGPTGPTGPPPAPPFEPPNAQQLAALALMEAPRVHASATTAALTGASQHGKVWFDGPCAFGSGSVQGSLDGGSSPAPGMFLPNGSHRYVASFDNCLLDFLAGIRISGVASAAYTAPEWWNITATVSAESVRGSGLSGYSELYDVTADGSALWTSEGFTRSTYTPVPGSRLVNNWTKNVATFRGGSYAWSLPGNSVSDRFDNFKIAINGTEYTLDGTLDHTFASYTFTGEIRITTNGTLVARLHSNVGHRPSIEVLATLVAL